MAHLATLAMAVSVMAMIVVSAVMAGFQERIRRHIRSAEPDLTIRLKERPLPPRTFEAISGELEGEMAAAGGPIAFMAPRSDATAMLANRLDEEGGHGLGGGSRVLTQTLKLVGIDWERDRRVIEWDRILSEHVPLRLRLHVPAGEDPFLWFPQGGMLVSVGLARLMGFEPGDGEFSASDASVVLGAFATDSAGRTVIEPSNKVFTVAGCFDSGRDDHDLNVVYVGLDAFRELRYGDALDAPDATSAVARLVERENVQETAAALASRHPGLLIETWEDRNQALLTALRVERTVTTAILFFIVILACLLLLGILHMIVIDKRRDLGILRSMGLSRQGTIGVFLLYGSLLGLLGVLMGTAAGVAVILNLPAIESWLASDLGIRIFAEQAYRHQGIPAILDAREVFAIGLASLLAAVAAAGVSAWRAAQATPVESLRYE